MDDWKPENDTADNARLFYMLHLFKYYEAHRPKATAASDWVARFSVKQRANPNLICRTRTVWFFDPCGFGTVVAFMG